ncbi:MAG TPA: hypothetical protein VI072_21410 [Polyangiaceae bacterium]
MKRSVKWRIAAVVLTASGLVAGTAAAVVNSSMPGTVCQAMFEVDNGLAGAGAPWLRHGAFWNTHSQGAVKNDHNSSGALVTCAVPRRNPSTVTGLADFEVYVNNAGGEFFCGLTSTDIYNVNITRVQRSTTSTGNRTLDWGNSVNVSHNKGTYAVDCVINPSSVIYGFWYSEN